MQPYAELLEFNQPNLYRKEGFTRIRDAFPGLSDIASQGSGPVSKAGPLSDFYDTVYNPERIVEFSGRWDYGEKNAAKLGKTVPSYKMTPDGIREEGEPMSIIRKYILMGHESMLEMADATFFIECSRVVSHELVRHRIASYQQESQRFVKYDDIEVDEMLYVPEGMDGPESDSLQAEMRGAVHAYKLLRDAGVAPQIARYVLPNGTRTRLIMKTNLREWRHIVNLRLSKSAQPEMQQLMQQIYDQLLDVFPNVMYDAVKEERAVR